MDFYDEILYLLKGSHIFLPKVLFFAFSCYNI